MRIKFFKISSLQMKVRASIGSHEFANRYLRLMDKILHDPKDPKLRELWSIPYYGSCRILSINRKANHELTFGITG